MNSYDRLPIVARFLPRRMSRSMLGLFDVARGADAIVDDPSLSLHERRLRIAGLREGLLHCDVTKLPIWALVHARDIARERVSPEFAMQLLDGFLSDTFTTRYDTYAQLQRYCLLSCAPLGRGFLAIAEENAADLAASDALCVALQLLNHWRDIASDARTLGRIYLPQEWWQQAGATEEELLSAQQLPETWSHCLHRLEQEIIVLLEQAAPLAASISRASLRFQLRWLCHAADHWRRALSGSDIIVEYVSPTRAMARQTAIQAFKEFF
jgi:phytoene/squalene synthetase